MKSVNFSVRTHLFNLHSTVTSHGWYTLEPFTYSDGILTFLFYERGKGTVQVRVFQKSAGRLEISASFAGSSVKNSVVEQKVVRVLSLDQNIREFYNIIPKTRRYHWIRDGRHGRFLRSPGLLEDLIKILFTVNCSFSMTRNMTSNLIRNYGYDYSEGRKCFPDTERMQRKTAAEFESDVRCGYRSGTVAELVGKISEIESLEPGDHAGMRAVLSDISGFGPYAVGQALRLQGCFSDLAVDSWCRKRFRKLTGYSGRNVDLKISEKYKEYEKWKGLMFWLDLTKSWHC